MPQLAHAPDAPFLNDSSAPVRNSQPVLALARGPARVSFHPLPDSEPLSAEPTRTTDPGLRSPEPMVAHRTCPSCMAKVPVGHKFCFECGAPMIDNPVEPTQVRAPNPFANSEPSSPAISPAAIHFRSNALEGRTAHSSPASVQRVHTPGPAKTLFFSAVQSARAKLTLIRGDGQDGVTFTLAGDHHKLGRASDCPLLFAEDQYLSPVHADFYYDPKQGNALVVRDEGSLNGVFVRILEPTKLHVGSRILAGEQILEVTAGHSGTPEYIEDGTYYFSSPSTPTAAHVVQRMRGGGIGQSVPLAGTLTLGREGNDMNFPADPFISGKHASIAVGSNGTITISDLQSKNGTFLRVAHEHVLKHGDYVFLGQQLLRVEIV